MATFALGLTTFCSLVALQLLFGNMAGFLLILTIFMIGIAWTAVWIYLGWHYLLELRWPGMVFAAGIVAGIGYFASVYIWLKLLAENLMDWDPMYFTDL